MNENSYIELVKADPVAASHLLVEKDKEILKLQQYLANANKARFGTKSEKLIVEQPSLFPLSELEEESVQEELPTVTVPEHTRRKKRTRREIPAGTPVNRIVHPPAAVECSCCGGALTLIREEVTKILNYEPASFELQEHVRPVMACSLCKESSPVTTKLPSGIQLIERSPAGVGLLTHILISKYQDHLPLNRLESMFARLGFELPRQRMCDWLAQISEVLHPLYRALKQELIPERYLQADETIVKIQDGETKGKCHTGYFWGILAPPLNLVYFHYADSRAGDVPKSLLSDFKGVLQTDLYAGYNKVYVPEHAVRAGCWAHVRRKFIEIQKIASKSDVNKALELIAKLYHAEPRDKPPDVILAARKKYSAPILEKLHQHLCAWSARTLPNSDVQKALKYALSQWHALSLFVSDATIRLDNNLIENQMRPIALGRKNWLFAGSHDGAMRAAIFFSLINSCRLNKVNTWHYFNDVLARIQGTPKHLLTNLLPNKWTPSHIKAAA